MRLQVVRDDALDLRRHVVAVDRMHVEPIEKRRRSARRPPVRDRSSGCVRRGTPSSAACRDRGRRAPSITVDCCGRSRSSMPLPRLVDRPSACAPRRRLRDATRVPAGSRRAPSSSGNSRSMTPSSSASAKPDRRPLGAAAAASRSRPRCARPAGRRAGCRGRASRGRAVHRRARTAPRTGCARSTRRLSSPNVARIDGAKHAALEQVAAAVERVEVLVRQRVPGDGVDGEVAAPRRLLRATCPDRR